MLINRNIVVVGTGSSTQRNTTDLLTNWLQPEKLDEPDTTYDFTVTLPLTPISWTTGLNNVLGWLENEQLEYRVIVDDTIDDDPEPQEIAKYAAGVHHLGAEADVELLSDGIAGELRLRPNPTLVVLIDPNTKPEDIDPLTVETMRYAEKEGWPVHNLSMGLLETKLSDFDSPEPPKPEPKRRTAAKDVMIEQEEELTDSTPPPARKKRRTKAEMDSARAEATPSRIRGDVPSDELIMTKAQLAEKIKAIKEHKEEELQATREIAQKIDYEPTIAELLKRVMERLDSLEAKVNGNA